tara:strand:- start:1265 stop:1990 length:726 start_codon:yes stop_codon:yes gene_type:complete
MHLETELSHISTERTVVKVQAWEDNKSLGSALGEGKTIDIAEENAILKLKSRIEALRTDLPKRQEVETFNSFNDDKKYKESQISNERQLENKSQSPPLKQKEFENTTTIPSDWGAELAAIDKELKRLKWRKEEEITYLHSLFGYSSRGKITKYIELKVLLMNLKEVETGSDPSSCIDTNENLINKSNNILTELKWNSTRGRKFLQDNFDLSSRNDLNKIQLMQFNLLLSEELTNLKNNNSI